MVPVASSGFLDAVLRVRPGAVSGAAWFDRRRAAALERANALSVPTTRDEDWRFTDLSHLARLSFQPVSEATALAEDALRELMLPEAHARLVFVDGVFAPRLSQRPAATAGVRVLDLRSALTVAGVVLEERLGELAVCDSNLFCALNTAFLHDGAAVILDAERSIPGPVHILHVATKRERPHALYPRTIVLAGAHSRCTLIEDFLCTGDATYFSAPVTEIALEPHAVVSHVRLQREAPEAFHLGTCAVVQRSGSRYSAIHVAFGARLSRLELNVLHSETQCETAIDGLSLIGQRQLADTHSFVDHAQPGGRLRQLHKCVTGGAAHAVFNGKILVREGAQHTDAAQSFRALLLSERAHIDAKPQLEIFADDVKCAHGAAIGQLDPEELFYLRSRGLSEQGARNLLTYAFAAEVIERIPVPTLAARLARTVLERTQEAV